MTKEESKAIRKKVIKRRQEYLNKTRLSKNKWSIEIDSEKLKEVISQETPVVKEGSK